MQGFKHLIQCHCVLPQYRKRQEPIFHKIEVFSILDQDTDQIKEKFIICDNCGSVHKVVDFCKSEIQTSHEAITSVRTIPEIKMSLDDNLCKILEDNNCHVSTWEHVEFILDNKIFNFPIVINRETIKDKISLKLFEIKDNGKYKISNELIENEVKLG